MLIASVLALLLAEDAAVDRNPTPPPIAAEPLAMPVKPCRTQPERVAKPEALRPQTLNQMPPAEAYYTVLRIEAGCETPVKVRDFRR